MVDVRLCTGLIWCANGVRARFGVQMGNGLDLVSLRAFCGRKCIPGFQCVSLECVFCFCVLCCLEVFEVWLLPLLPETRSHGCWLWERRHRRTDPPFCVRVYMCVSACLGDFQRERVCLSS